MCYIIDIEKFLNKPVFRNSGISSNAWGVIFSFYTVFLPNIIITTLLVTKVIDFNNSNLYYHSNFVFGLGFFLLTIFDQCFILVVKRTFIITNFSLLMILLTGYFIKFCDTYYIHHEDVDVNEFDIPLYASAPILNIQ